jgi:hypothetical protein
MEDLMVLLGIVWIGVAWLWEQLQDLARFVFSPEGFRIVVVLLLIALLRRITTCAEGLWRVIFDVEKAVDNQSSQQGKALDRLTDEVRDLHMTLTSEVCNLRQDLTATPLWQDQLAAMRQTLEDIHILLDEAEAARRAKEFERGA